MGQEQRGLGPPWPPNELRVCWAPRSSPPRVSRCSEAGPGGGGGGSPAHTLGRAWVPRRKPLTCFLAKLVEEALAQVGVVPEGQLQERSGLLQLLHEPQASGNEMKPKSTTRDRESKSNRGESHTDRGLQLPYKEERSRRFSKHSGRQTEVCILGYWRQGRKIVLQNAMATGVAQASVPSSPLRPLGSAQAPDRPLHPPACVRPRAAMLTPALASITSQPRKKINLTTTQRNARDTMSTDVIIPAT